MIITAYVQIRIDKDSTSLSKIWGCPPYEILSPQPRVVICLAEGGFSSVFISFWFSLSDTTFTPFRNVYHSFCDSYIHEICLIVAICWHHIFPQILSNCLNCLLLFCFISVDRLHLVSFTICVKILYYSKVTKRGTSIVRVKLDIYLAVYGLSPGGLFFVVVLPKMASSSHPLQKMAGSVPTKQPAVLLPPPPPPPKMPKFDTKFSRPIFYSSITLSFTEALSAKYPKN